MTSSPSQLDLFEKVDEIVYLRCELEQLLEQSDQLMKTIYCRHNDLSKLYLSLKTEYEFLLKRLDVLENELIDEEYLNESVQSSFELYSSPNAIETQLTLSF